MSDTPWIFGVRKPLDLDPAHERDVRAAFAEAARAGRPLVERYWAAIAVFRQLCPMMPPRRAAEVAVCVVLDHEFSRSITGGTNR